MVKERDVSTIHLISLLRFLNYFDRNMENIEGKVIFKTFPQSFSACVNFQKGGRPTFQFFSKEKS